MGFDEDLEEKLEDHRNAEKPKEDIGALVNAIDKFISTLDDGEISWLIPENVMGLEEAKVFQQNIEDTFGWRIRAIDELIVTKLVYTKSIDGRMIDKKIGALSVLKADIQAHIDPSMSDRLLGENIRQMR